MKKKILLYILFKQEKNEVIKRFTFEVVKSEQTIKIETQKLEMKFK